MEGNYCAYLRKSRKDLEAEARGEGETLARHERILLDLAHRMNVSLTAIYKEVVSGETISARPVVQQVLHEVEDGIWTGVFVVEIERLARGDTRDQGYVAEAFTYSDTKIITPLKIYDPADPADQEYFEFNLFMSRREYKTINRRLETGRHQSFLEGKFLGSAAPYGWERCKLEHQKGFSLRPHPQEGKYLVMMYNLIAYGSDGTPMGPDQVANLFNDMGIPSRTGTRWTGTTIRGIINNEHNMGLVRRGWRKTVKKMQNGHIVKTRPKQKNYELVNGLHEGQVSEEVFRLANENIHSSAPPVNRDYTVKNPLAGLVICSCCGHAMRRRPTAVKVAYDFLYCPYGCKTIGTPLYLVENAVLDILKEWTGKYQLQQTSTADWEGQDLIQAKQQVLAEKEADLEKLNKQRGSLYDFLEQGVYTTEVFLARQNNLSKREKKLMEELSRLQDEIEYERKIENERVNFIPKCKKLIDNYEFLSIQEKNRFLKELIDRIVYTKTERNQRGKGDVAKFTLEIYPRVPRS